MEPWYKVTTPRKEVREGRSFNPAEFAIALEQVVAGIAQGITQTLSNFSRGRVSPAHCENTPVWCLRGWQERPKIPHLFLL